MDYKERIKKEQTSYEAFNIMSGYFIVAWCTGAALAFHHLMKISTSGYYRVEVIPSTYYWWVFGTFCVSILALAIGHYCLKSSIDS